jgi:hypothetical protein
VAAGLAKVGVARGVGVPVPGPGREVGTSVGVGDLAGAGAARWAGWLVAGDVVGPAGVARATGVVGAGVGVGAANAASGNKASAPAPATSRRTLRISPA